MDGYPPRPQHKLPKPNFKSSLVICQFQSFFQMIFFFISVTLSAFMDIFTLLTNQYLYTFQYLGFPCFGGLIGHEKNCLTLKRERPDTLFSRFSCSWAQAAPLALALRHMYAGLCLISKMQQSPRA